MEGFRWQGATHIGWEDESGRPYCCDCLGEGEACGVLYVGDLDEARGLDTRCSVCRYRLVAFMFACEVCDRDASGGVMDPCGRLCGECAREYLPAEV